MPAKRLQRVFYLSFLTLVFDPSLSMGKEITLPTKNVVIEKFKEAVLLPERGDVQDVHSMFQGPIEIRYELGRWLPKEEVCLLVTIDILGEYHARGMVNEFFAIMNLRNHNLQTPVFHYRSDSAIRRVFRTAGQDHLFYAGRLSQQGWIEDRSFLVSFSQGKVVSDSPLGELSKEKYTIVINGEYISLLEGTMIERKTMNTNQH